ncbi:MAG: Methyltransferase type 11 [Acidobacteria bacterium]|nr:Methyltransferase type 11 [Acidobacteriota bacterium]
MTPRLATTQVRDHGDVRAFFDRSARSYVEQHGPAARLLRYRTSLLREAARFEAGDTVLELGCGDGMHLFAMSDAFARGIGIDISEAMVARARATAGDDDRFRFAAGVGEEIPSVDDGSIDVVYCVGSLEHMLDQPAVARSAYRVLRRGGRFAGLTPNGEYVWYRRIAPLLGLETRHLATDRFLTRGELAALLHGAGFTEVAIDSWTFIPRGDMPRWVARLLDILDAIGRTLGIRALRGGLRFHASRDE